jgi:tRNA(Arg) A34 adenosine deaminase TadA
LRRAIELSQQARAAGNQPFGSLLVDASGEILAQDVNTEITDNDITAHPELKLARWAAANLWSMRRQNRRCTRAAKLALCARAPS